MQTLDSSVAAAQLRDRHVAGATARAARRARKASATASPGERLVLRRAAAKDDAALARLAQLDSAPRLSGDVLVAVIEDEIVAAVPFAGGRAIADPFRPTAELVELLRRQAGLLAPSAPATRLRRLRPQMRLRIAA